MVGFMRLKLCGMVCLYIVFSLGQRFGLKVKEVEDLPITDFAEIVMAIIKEPDFVDFIKVVLKSFN